MWAGGRTPHPCDLCGKVFRDERDLKRHMMIHTGEKPYHCLDCADRYRQKAHLKRHVKRNHDRELLPEELIPHKDDL